MMVCVHAWELSEFKNQYVCKLCFNFKFVNPFSEYGHKPHEKAKYLRKKFKQKRLL